MTLTLVKEKKFMNKIITTCSFKGNDKFLGDPAFSPAPHFLVSFKAMFQTFILLYIALHPLIFHFIR